MTTFGHVDGIRFELALDLLRVPCTAADATRGTLRVLVRGEPVWPSSHSGGFQWTWVEIVEFLTNAWPYLRWEEGFPLGTPSATPAQVRAHLENRWLESPDTRRLQEEAVFDSFQETHDLSRGISAAAPPIWIVREGRRCWIACSGRVVHRQCAEVFDALAGLGDALVARLAALPSDPRATAAVLAWQRREEALTDAQRVEIATGLDASVLEAVRGGRSWSDVWELPDGPFEVNEVLAAARMSAGLPATVVRRVNTAIRGAKLAATPELDELAKRARAAIATTRDERPHDQGYALATWLRRERSLSDQEMANPRAWLAAWNVAVHELDLDAIVDAVACWGPRHGPAIFLNPQGLHHESDGGRNATLAHEICHLLVDREDGLPLAEVLGGSAIPSMEPRARAFAAELLVPRRIAGEIMSRAVGNGASALAGLAARYQASLELCAWQVRNSGVKLAPGVARFLRTKVSQPDRY